MEPEKFNRRHPEGQAEKSEMLQVFADNNVRSRTEIVESLINLGHERQIAEEIMTNAIAQGTLILKDVGLYMVAE